jgi:hypothetical protein
VAQALLTAVALGLFGLAAAAVVGLQGTDLSRHISFGFFSTLILLLAHSMMMFYFIGKGRAVKDALAEAGRGADDPKYRLYVGRVAAARRPVFSFGSIAMIVTIVAALLGASVDTGVLPPVVHAMMAYAAIAGNLAAARIEIAALAESRRVVDDVNRLLG